MVEQIDQLLGRHPKEVVSALYSAPNLKLLQGLRWISRVPLTVAEAKRLVDQLDEQEFVATSLPGYRIVERNSLYGGVTLSLGDS